MRNTISLYLSLTYLELRMDVVGFLFRVKQGSLSTLGERLRYT